jgi:glycosyltransferase involved in cell wall biosynthesis
MKKNECSNISIIIPVYNAENTLDQCLQAVTLQRYDGTYEIIVIDNGSNDESRSIISRYKAVRLLNCAVPGPAATRNVGINASLYDLIAFTDSDCVPDSNWLENLEKSLTPVLVGVGGPIKNISKGRISDYIATISFNQHQHVTSALPYLATANALFRKCVLLEVGGFDETFEIAGGEDDDLGIRLKMKGYNLGFAPEAKCAHFHANSILDFVSQRIRYGFGDAKVLSKYTRVIEVQLEFHSFLDRLMFLCNSIKQQFRYFLTTDITKGLLAIISDIAFFTGFLLFKIRRPTQLVRTHFNQCPPAGRRKRMRKTVNVFWMIILTPVVSLIAVAFIFVLIITGRYSKLFRKRK